MNETWTWSKTTEVFFGRPLFSLAGFSGLDKALRRWTGCNIADSQCLSCSNRQLREARRILLSQSWLPKKAISCFFILKKRHSLKSCGGFDTRAHNLLITECHCQHKVESISWHILVLLHYITEKLSENQPSISIKSLPKIISSWKIKHMNRFSPAGVVQCGFNRHAKRTGSAIRGNEAVRQIAGCRGRN